jgi:voltage-gated potassium channel
VDDRSRQWQRRLEVPVLAAALLSIPVIVVEQSDASERWRSAAAATNWLIWLVFAAEVAIMLVVVPDRRRWLRSHPLDLAILVLTPPFMPSSLQAFRVLRLLRLLRVARALVAARALFTLAGLRYVAILAAATALGGGAAFAAAEGHELSTWDGVWWALTTMTTVGYGDISPHTDLGRVIAIAVMLVGIGFVAVLTAALAQRFVVEDVRQEVAAVEDHVAEDIVQAEADVLSEIRAIGAQLRSLEGRLARDRRA